MDGVTSDQIVQIIGAVTALVAAIGSIVATVLAYQARNSAKDASSNVSAVQETINGHMASLVASTERAARAEGKVEVAEALGALPTPTHPPPESPLILPPQGGGPS